MQLMARGSDLRTQPRPPFPSPDNFPSRSLALQSAERFPITSKFTDSIVAHGRWKNSTLDEATNLRQRDLRTRERTMRKMEQMSHKFRWDVEEVQRMQEVVRARQRRLTQTNLQVLSAIMIQTTWRMARAKIQARERRGKILGNVILRHWRSYKVRRRFAVLKVFTWDSIRRRTEQTQKMSEAAQRIQNAWRRRTMRNRTQRLVMGSVAIEVVVEELLEAFVETVHIHDLVMTIAKGWKRSRLRRQSKSLKSLQSRTFVTQGGGSQRKSRPVGVRSGLASDSGWFSRQGKIPSPLRGQRGRLQIGTPFESSCISMGTVVLSATATGGRNLSSNSNASFRSNLSASAGYRGRPKRYSISRPPYSTVATNTWKAGGFGSGGGGVGGGRRTEDTGGAVGNVRRLSNTRKPSNAKKPSLPGDRPAVNVTVTGMSAQPRRPSAEKPSKLLEDRAHPFTVGGGDQMQVTAATTVRSDTEGVELEDPAVSELLLPTASSAVGFVEALITTAATKIDSEASPRKTESRSPRSAATDVISDAEGVELENHVVSGLLLPLVSSSAVLVEALATTAATKVDFEAVSSTKAKNRVSRSGSSSDTGGLMSANTARPGEAVAKTVVIGDRGQTLRESDNRKLESPVSLTRSCARQDYASDTFESDGETSLAGR